MGPSPSRPRDSGPAPPPPPARSAPGAQSLQDRGRLEADLRMVCRRGACVAKPATWGWITLSRAATRLIPADILGGLQTTAAQIRADVVALRRNLLDAQGVETTDAAGRRDDESR